MFDVMIVGSGPAGTFAAQALQGKKILMLDVGKKPPASSQLQGNLYEQRLRTPDLFESLIGQEFQTLRNLHAPKKISLKLKSPDTSYIIENWETLSPLKSETFDTAMSFAEGGLANAWGAGVYRFTDRDLQGFPISSTDLTPYYDFLTEHIGVSGTSDSLDSYFGTTKGLQRPLRMSAYAQELLNKFDQRQSEFNQSGLYLGHPRLAVLTEKKGNRDEYRYENYEFFKSHIPAVYNPAYTLRDLVAQNALTYRTGVLVLDYSETQDQVEVHARNLDTGAIETFSARKLILAAGALNSTKIVLRSHRDHTTKLPILDNPMSCIPLIQLSRIGAKLDAQDSSLAQLNLIYDGPQAKGVVQASFYGTTGPLRSDIIFDFPLSIKSNLTWSRYLAPAMGLLMVFYPGEENPQNWIKLGADDQLEIHYESEKLGSLESTLIRKFRKLGYYGAAALCQYPKIGNSLHYAGMLPMMSQPKRYQTDPQGKLFEHRHTFVADGACFTRLPSKNLTFTIMANSMRIASKIRADL